MFAFVITNMPMQSSKTRFASPVPCTYQYGLIQKTTETHRTFK